MDMDGGKRIFQRLGPSTSNDNGFKQQKVCFHWRQGRCNRGTQCMYLHQEGMNNGGFSSNSRRAQEGMNNGGFSSNSRRAQEGMNNGGFSSKRAHGFSEDDSARSGLRRNTNFNNKWGKQQPQNNSRGVVKIDKVCKYWLQGSCSFGDQCRFSHSWSSGDCFSLLTQLEGHQKDIKGIALPSGSDKLYTGSKDETVRVWDCQSGQCAGAISVGAEIGCMISEGPWVFVGLMNLVKAWNTQTNTELSLPGPVGQVYSLVVGSDLLMAGTQDGTILVWKFNVTTNNFEPAASLKGHTLAVVTMVVGANRLYSGSMDSTIRVWSLETLQCLQTLSEHSNVVMSVLCWDQFLLSCSLDKTIKVWAATDSGNLEVTYTHNEQHGLLTLCGMHDTEAKPVLLCSCNDSTDNCIRVYDLPSFSERGKIYSKQHVLSIQTGPPGLFFTGDGTGLVRVWQWVVQQQQTPSE